MKIFSGWALLLLLAFVVLPGGESVAEEIPVYTYHTHPPFITGEKKGLSYDLARYLTEKSNGDYSFSLMPMSRPRVNKMLAESRNGIVAWVNPVWFKDEAEQKYMWTKPFVMMDGNAIISHVDLSLHYNGPESFDGLVFGGVRGHIYAGIDKYIASTGKTKRVDAEGHLDNFRKLVKGRVDVTITPISAAEYFIENEGLQDQLFISPTPHSRFKRRVIVVDRREEVLEFIEKTIFAMAIDDKWQEIVSAYR